MLILAFLEKVEKIVWEGEDKIDMSDIFVTHVS